MTEPRYIQTGETFIKLWIHEVLRVFGDRLVSDIDLRILQDNIVSLVKNKFKQQNHTYDTLFNAGPIYFGEVHKGDLMPRPYEEIRDTNILVNKLEFFLEMYNKKYKKSPMNLVFFDYAVSHILRITRVLRQPRGNMVLIGNGGTGKQVIFFIIRH